MDNQALLDEFASTLLTERGISDEVPEKVRDRMKKDILERLNNFLISRCLEKLSEEKINELGEMTNKEDGKKVWEYVRSNIEDFDKFSMEVLADFRSKYLGL